MATRYSKCLVTKKTYKVLNKDPKQRTERKLNEKLGKLKREDKTSDTLYKKVRSSNGLLLVFMVHRRFIDLVTL